MHIFIRPKDVKVRDISDIEGTFSTYEMVAIDIKDDTESLITLYLKDEEAKMLYKAIEKICINEAYWPENLEKEIEDKIIRIDTLEKYLTNMGEDVEDIWT